MHAWIQSKAVKFYIIKLATDCQVLTYTAAYATDIYWQTSYLLGETSPLPGHFNLAIDN